MLLFDVGFLLFFLAVEVALFFFTPALNYIASIKFLTLKSKDKVSEPG
jgi:hypothetical protein